eukprot:scaffold776_cov347-Pavlova_lutheri.AAC.27
MRRVNIARTTQRNSKPQRPRMGHRIVHASSLLCNVVSNCQVCTLLEGDGNDSKKIVSFPSGYVVKDGKTRFEGIVVYEEKDLV